MREKHLQSLGLIRKIDLRLRFNVEQPIQTAEPLTSSATPLQKGILRVLLYYDIWAYPLTARQLFTFLPLTGITFEEFCTSLGTNGAGTNVNVHDGFYFVRGSAGAVRFDAKILRSGEGEERVLDYIRLVRNIK